MNRVLQEGLSYANTSCCWETPPKVGKQKADCPLAAFMARPLHVVTSREPAGKTGVEHGGRDGNYPDFGSDLIWVCPPIGINLGGPCSRSIHCSLQPTWARSGSTAGPRCLASVLLLHRNIVLLISRQSWFNVEIIVKDHALNIAECKIPKWQDSPPEAERPIPRPQSKTSSKTRNCMYKLFSKGVVILHKQMLSDRISYDSATTRFNRISEDGAPMAVQVALDTDTLQLCIHCASISRKIESCTSTYTSRGFANSTPVHFFLSSHSILARIFIVEGWSSRAFSCEPP